MTRLKKVFFALAFMALPFSMAGCQAVDSTMKSVHNVFDEYLPKQSPREQQEEQPMQAQEQTQPAEQSESAPTQMAATEQGEEESAAPQKIRITKITQAENKNCPEISIVEDLDSLHQFMNPHRPSPESRISSIYMQELKTSCVYNENNVVVDLDLTFAGKLGPRARVWNTDKPSFAYPYFVAITTSDGNIAAKEVFAATVSYDRDDITAIHHENMRQIIPQTGSYDTDYEILIGFQLSEGELAYNRSLREGTVAAPGVSEQYIGAGKEERKMMKSAVLEPILIIPPAKPALAEKQAAAPQEPQQKQVTESTEASAPQTVAEEDKTATIDITADDIATADEETVTTETKAEETIAETTEEAPAEKATYQRTVEEVAAEPPPISAEEAEAATQAMEEKITKDTAEEEAMAEQAGETSTSAEEPAETPPMFDLTAPVSASSDSL